jgi:hypothetical protein
VGRHKPKNGVPLRGRAYRRDSAGGGAVRATTVRLSVITPSKSGAQPL